MSHTVEGVAHTQSQASSVLPHASMPPCGPGGSLVYVYDGSSIALIAAAGRNLPSNPTKATER